MASIDFGFSVISIILGLGVFLYLTHDALKRTKSSEGIANLGELDNGEIRKAIAIAFTVIYIILLPYYFFNAYMPAAVNISKNNATELVTSLTKSGQLQAFNVTANSVPAMAMNDLLRNFLYVYIFIIVFYFGSRAIDGYTEAKRIEKLTGSNAIDIIRTQYARGKIDKTTMETRINDLKKQEGSSNQPTEKGPDS